MTQISHPPVTSPATTWVKIIYLFTQLYCGFGQPWLH